jgi:hypothetical protein
MDEKEQCCFVENVGKINENIPWSAPIQMWSSILLDVDVIATYEWRSKS